MAAHTSALLLWRLHQRSARALATLPTQTGSRELLAELTHRYVPYVTLTTTLLLMSDTSVNTVL